MVHETNLGFDQVHTLYCYLCGTTIDRKYAQFPDDSEAWRAYAQELSLRHSGDGEGPLVEPRPYPLTIRGQARHVHQACFGVVTSLWDRDTFTAAQLDGFLSCARDIGPFLAQIPAGASPDRLDKDLAPQGPERR